MQIMQQGNSFSFSPGSPALSLQRQGFNELKKENMVPRKSSGVATTDGENSHGDDSWTARIWRIVEIASAILVALLLDRTL